LRAVAELYVAHTGDLDRGTLREMRRLLDAVFGDGFTDYDWEHALGGMHALVREGGDLLGHASVVQRVLLHARRTLRTGYIEGVGVRADRRGRGHGAAMMEALERVVRGAYELGALSAAEAAAGFYMARGWKRWRGATWALTPDGVRRTAEEDGGIYVLPIAVSLDLSGDLTCDWRDGDVW
jgi:aminoglycoside 2'-N-acetyltransferase I